VIFSRFLQLPYISSVLSSYICASFHIAVFPWILSPGTSPGLCVPDVGILRTPWCPRCSGPATPTPRWIRSSTPRATATSVTLFAASSSAVATRDEPTHAVVFSCFDVRGLFIPQGKWSSVAFCVDGPEIFPRPLRANEFKTRYPLGLNHYPLRKIK